MDDILIFDGDGRALQACSAPHTSCVVAIDKACTEVCTGVGSEQDLDAGVANDLRPEAPDHRRPCYRRLMLSSVPGQADHHNTH
jgi:hypothetical protein